MGYYRRFVPQFASIAAPLVALTDKEVVYAWSAACQTAFERLRETLISAPLLHFPRKDLPYVVDTDASEYGIGGVLAQQDGDQELVIAYYSKSLNAAQRKYCTTRKELLAMVAVLQANKSYLLGGHFSVRTDHKALLWLARLKDAQGMMARWFNKLQQFDFTITHRAGKKHLNADGLSRCPQCTNDSCIGASKPNDVVAMQPYACTEIGSSNDSLILPMESGEDWIATLQTVGSESSSLGVLEQFKLDQRSDPVLKITIAWCEGQDCPDDWKEVPQSSRELQTLWLGRANLYVSENGLLWRRSTSLQLAQLVVPAARRH